MLSLSSFRLILAVGVPVAVVWALASTVCAVEPTAQFLDGMRNRGYFDLAIYYLERMDSNPLVAPEDKQSKLFEHGVTLIRASRVQRDPSIRSAQLDDAQSRFREFVEQQPNHELVSTARSQLGNVLIERARMNVIRSKKPSELGRKEERLATARQQYEDGQAVFETLIGDLKELLSNGDKYPAAIDKEAEPELFAERGRLRAEYVQSQLVAATIMYEKAETAEKGSDAYKELLTAAAEKYAELAEKYRTRLAGLYALMYEAQCYQDMGNNKDALSRYSELLDQPDDPAPFRKLKTKALKGAIECSLEEDPPLYAESITQGEAWLLKGRPNETKDLDWLHLRLSVARAYIVAASALEKSEPGSKFIGRHRGSAKKLAKFVERIPGETQSKAREILAELGTVIADEGPREEPTNFAEARTAGKEALDEMKSASVLEQILQGKMKSSTGAELDEMEGQLIQAQETKVKKAADAMRYFEMAVQMVGADTPIDDVNVVRYFLGYLYYTEERFFDSAVMAGFLARRYPESAGARQSAKIALASFLNLYQGSKDAGEENFEFEVAQIERIAEHIAAKWPDQPEANDARNTLINITIQQGRLDDAQRFLQQIPTDSPRRGDAELKTGQAMWSKYLTGIKVIQIEERELKDQLKKVDDSQRPAIEDQLEQIQGRKTELDPIKQRAQQTLVEGINRMKEGDITPTLMAAVLSLTQIYVDANEPAKCIALLEDPKVGALVLVRAGDASTDRTGYADETYKTALRAYISSLPNAETVTDGDAIMAKAEGVMNSLEESFSGSEEKKSKLIAIYISLAHDLKKQLELTDDKARKSLSSGFEQFLTRVGDTSTDYSVLTWVAEMFYSLGSSNDSSGTELGDDPRDFYAQAVGMYEKILGMNDAGQLELDPKHVIQGRMRLAVIKRRLGHYKEAVDMFESILKEKNSMVNVQVEAATTYQEWARSSSNPIVYKGAIYGGRKNKQVKPVRNIIWGWGRLAKIAAEQMRRDPKYAETFHKARFNLAVCRQEFAVRQDGAERKKNLKLAKRDISLTAQLYPDLGGAEWRSKYNQLYMRIQAALGEEPVGLAARQVGEEGT